MRDPYCEEKHPRRVMRDPFRVSRGCLCEKRGALVAIAAGRRGPPFVARRMKVGQGPSYATRLMTIDGRRADSSTPYGWGGGRGAVRMFGGLPDGRALGTLLPSPDSMSMMVVRATS